MWELDYVCHSGKIWGRMPSGEILEYDTISLYQEAYRAEENEIVDEMARLEEEKIRDYPEDWRVTA